MRTDLCLGGQLLGLLAEVLVRIPHLDLQLLQLLHVLPAVAAGLQCARPAAPRPPPGQLSSAQLSRGVMGAAIVRSHHRLQGAPGTSRAVTPGLLALTLIPNNKELSYAG